MFKSICLKNNYAEENTNFPEYIVFFVTSWAQGTSFKEWARNKLENSTHPNWGQCWQQVLHTSPCVCARMLVAWALQLRATVTAVQSNARHNSWHLDTRAVLRKKRHSSCFLFTPLPWPTFFFFFVTLKGLFLTELRFRNNSQWRQSTFLGNLFLTFFFGFPSLSWLNGYLINSAASYSLSVVSLGQHVRTCVRGCVQ